MKVYWQMKGGKVMNDIAVPIFKKPGWYDEHPFKSFIERFYKDLDGVYLWIGPGQCTVDHDNPEYHKFLDKYALGRDVWDFDLGKRVCMSVIEEIMIEKYTKDDSFSKESQDDLYYVLYNVMHDYIWPREPETINNNLSAHYQKEIEDRIRENNGHKVVKYENGESYDIVEVFTQKAFSSALSDYFWEWKRRKNNYAWYKKS